MPKRYIYVPRSGIVLIDHAKLRYWRDYYLFTRGELAADVGVSERTIQSWELGDRSPTPQNFRKLLFALGVSPDELMLPGYRFRDPEPGIEDEEPKL